MKGTQDERLCRAVGILPTDNWGSRRDFTPKMTRGRGPWAGCLQHKITLVRYLVYGCLLLISGCAFAPRERLTFPTKPAAIRGDTTWYAMHGDGKPDFGAVNVNGRVDRLVYDDDADGIPDRVYRLGDYADDSVPHVVLMLDSIPFQFIADRYAAGDLRLFYPPVKTIAPFPSLTEICYGEMLHAPPLPTVIDTQYDPRLGEHRSDVWKRVNGYVEPWERRLDYELSFAEAGLSFVDPHAWYAAELSRAKRAIDDSPRRVTYVYFASAASLVCKEGKAGATEVLDGAERLCLQLLCERHGAIRISMLADHGHNFMASKNVPLADWLTNDGFHVTDSPKTPQDVTVSINGLVTNALLTTGRPEPVAAALLKHDAVDLAVYLRGDRVIVRGHGGTAAIEARGQTFRYVQIDNDVLAYLNTIKTMQAAGQADADGFATEDAWFHATLDHPWPNAPARLWTAFHRQTVTPPTIMLSFKDGFYCGRPGYEDFITMKSTHGGLNQVNSATFVMSMCDVLHGPLLHRDILKTLAPNDPPAVVR